MIFSMTVGSIFVNTAQQTRAPLCELVDKWMLRVNKIKYAAWIRAKFKLPCFALLSLQEATCQRGDVCQRFAGLASPGEGCLQFFPPAKELVSDCGRPLPVQGGQHPWSAPRSAASILCLWNKTWRTIQIDPNVPRELLRESHCSITMHTLTFGGGYRKTYLKCLKTEHYNLNVGKIWIQNSLFV